MVKHWYRAILALLFLTITLFCISQAAQAGTATLSWTLPTTYVGGTPIGSAPVTTRIYRATTQAGLATAPVLTTTAAGATGYTDTTAPTGTVWYQISAVVNGQESARTTAVSTTIADPAPNPPTGFTVTPVVAGLNMNPVYRINADGTRGSVVLGFVPVGVHCIGPVVYTYRQRPYRRVDPAMVKWERTAPTTSIATACG